MWVRDCVCLHLLWSHRIPYSINHFSLFSIRTRVWIYYKFYELQLHLLFVYIYLFWLIFLLFLRILFLSFICLSIVAATLSIWCWLQCCKAAVEKSKSSAWSACIHAWVCVYVWERVFIQNNNIEPLGALCALSAVLHQSVDGFIVRIKHVLMGQYINEPQWN